MLKPPAPTMPGMTDTLDFVKNLWGSMNLPGAGVPGMSGLAGPTLSTDDLDKRIADLKAVESWLNMNLTMLRGTIQAMEVQRGTLAALKSMSASMAEAMRQSGVGADKMAAMPFAAFFNPAGQSTSSTKPSAPPSPAPGPAAASPGGDSAQPGTGSPAGADASVAAMGMPAAVAWWNMLQEQFTQAVTSAMSSAASAAPGASPAVPPSASTGAPFPPDENDAPPASASRTPPEPAAGANGGKTRTPRSRADKA